MFAAEETAVTVLRQGLLLSEDSSSNSRQQVMLMWA